MALGLGTHLLSGSGRAFRTQGPIPREACSQVSLASIKEGILVQGCLRGIAGTLQFVLLKGECPRFARVGVPGEAQLAGVTGLTWSSSCGCSSQHRSRRPVLSRFTSRCRPALPAVLRPGSRPPLPPTKNARAAAPVSSRHPWRSWNPLPSAAARAVSSTRESVRTVL